MSNNEKAPVLSREEKAIAKANAKMEKKLAKKRTKIRESFGDSVLLAVTTIILLAVLIIVGYPVLYVISSSFSSNKALNAGRVILFPVDPSLASYKFVFQYTVVWNGFKMTVFYTVVGVIITMLMQILCAYPLSKRSYQGRGLLMMVFFVTTMVGAGMIPTLLLRSAMGLRNNVWAVILAGIMSVHNMIILRTCFRNSIPGELYDAAAIDGANDFQTLFQIAFPLAKATLSVLTLYSAVGNWNEYFTSMIYLPNKPDLWPLQLVLRPIMMASKTLQVDGGTGTSDQLLATENGTEGVVFALIVITTVPVLLMYFVVQKYFEKGVMVGSVKG